MEYPYLCAIVNFIYFVRPGIRFLKGFLENSCFFRDLSISKCDFNITFVFSFVMFRHDDFALFTYFRVFSRCCAERSFASYICINLATFGCEFFHGRDTK